MIAVFRVYLRLIAGEDIDFQCDISHAHEWDPHCGLGSTSNIAVGVLLGLNSCFNNIFSREELRLMLACNYVEESQELVGQLRYGYETTMTATGSVAGGLFVING